VAGGIYLGQGRAVQQRSAQAQIVVQTDADDMQLLKQRASEHAAARAWRSQAEGDAAAKAATEAKAAASKARTLEIKVIAKKEADKKAAAAKKAGTSTGASAPYAGPIPSSCSVYTGNRAVGCALMLDAGFKIDQFPCLDKLWDRESGWNAHASNSSTGAYGIPQALPGSKMASAGADWQTNPATQIKWGIGYIKAIYGDPCKAWSFWQANNYY
jgi:hypothetical protein